VTAARSLAQQLVQEPGVSCAAELAVILAELERVERQVADLLRFARRDELRREPTDLATLVRGTLARFAPRLERAGIAVDVALADGVTVLVDREKVQQVLVNVIENALDALVEDGADRRLHITVAAGDGTALLRVSDNGPGVAADAVARLFEPFFSLKAHGTGLGLAIAKRTIDAHGGRISAEAGTHAGMTMRVELPLERA
jgi:signal transduction histidine kinase